ncbi:MAG: hypothetical protein K2Z25_05170 [Beijerinckiaceae bacterium]|nr:hypothetical protein [Beijerinckiaceae bacterium]
MTTEPEAPSRLRMRRVERLRREIALLERMDGRLWRKAALASVIGVVFIALLLMAVAAKLQYFMYHPLAVAMVALAVAALVWWLGRYTLWVPVILVVLLLAILFEGDVGGWDFGGDGGKAKVKPDRQGKLNAALSRRRTALAKLERRA